MISRTHFKRIDIDFLLVLALCLFTLWPLLQNPGLPNGTDTLYHIYRSAEMDRSWAHSLLIPRWAETFYFGYGSPLFHYYAGLTYYITSILMRVFSVDAVNALRVFIVLCMLIAGGGTYLFMRDRTESKLAGVIAAVVYVYTPYIAYKEPYARGDFPELLALALLPLILWRFERFLQTGRGVDWVLAGIAFGLVVITHNLMALVVSVIVAAWLCWNVVTRLVSLHRFIFACAAVALGIGLTAYFWLPALAETSAVQFANLITLAELDYRNFFVPFNHLLAPTPRLDGGAINGLLPLLHIGQAQWLFALAGIVGFLIVPKLRTSPLLRTLLFFVLLGGSLIFLVTPGSQFVWAILRPLAFLQFPWRFLGPIAFCLAVLAGMGGLWLEMMPRRVGQVLTIAAVVVPVVLAMPLFYVPEWTNTTVDTSVAGYHHAETSGKQMATTYSSEYLPVSVYSVPSPTERLLDDYADGYPVDKAHREILPEGISVEPLEHSPQHDVWQVNADVPFTMEVLTFNFAGWQAEINGVSVPIRSSDPHGLITFDVPEGDHTVRVFLGFTPMRILGIGVTAAACIFAVIMIRKRGIVTGYTPELQHRGAVMAGGGVALVLLVVLMRPGVMWVESPPGTALIAQHRVQYNLSDTIHIVGYDLNSQNFRPGERVELSVYWYAAREPVEYGYASFVHISTGGPPLTQADKLNPAGRPTKEWTSDSYLYDPYVITLPETMPPGEYQVMVGLYTCDTLPAGECGNGDRLELVNAEGAIAGDAVVLATIMVR